MAQIPKQTITKRKVFLVNGYSEISEELNVFNAYIEYYKRFFKSIVGGSYYESEVIHLNQPAYSELNEILQDEEVDYGILIFLGHGAINRDNQLFQLNKSEIIKAGQYTISAKKQLIILDSCRTFNEYINSVDWGNRTPIFKSGGKIRLSISITTARERYDSWIKNCKDGICICFPCEIGETANNFYFSYLLIETAINWHFDLKNTSPILTIDEIMSILASELPNHSSNTNGVTQNPETRGAFEFPFAVGRF